MRIIQESSTHRQGNWQGQYNRMVRWVNRFQELSQQEVKSSEKTHIYFDTLYACFQNIFFLKDWLRENTPISSHELNTFINSNEEIGVCRDICNGTKHYNISNPSIDDKFGIIKQYVPFNKKRDVAEWEIIICAGGRIYKPDDLIFRCIKLWDDFIRSKLNLEKKGISA